MTLVLLRVCLRLIKDPKSVAPKNSKFLCVSSIKTQSIKLLIYTGVALGTLNVVSNIILPLSILHLLLADLLWITYIYKSAKKSVLLENTENIGEFN